jgi:ORF6N domain
MAAVPADFMFQLSPGEFENLKSQIVTSSWADFAARPPYAFTEQGGAMLSSVVAYIADSCYSAVVL